ncbi:YchJ family metal-binding protein [Herbaspirillum sp. RTI4]|uniref:YchJ family protein n=1 Tax=Herbaspirillum sp. RTI4 TaxID=3048640 RepID=UPI002AB36CEC|nr:YchJ family metal-binding protein [Herbaspirillum sp. RTI4]MDY7577421.1 YchJ family metal-binding protein [Herbaspirillum sp. RTI4]MEA9981697.1 YchJ family metal-binding protein [Herbaspirillum sp. RTI4]
MARSPSSSAAKMPCPCGGASYATCCGRFLDGAALPDTAVELMRSRYTAYIRCDEAWLRATWHPDTLPDEPLTGENDVKWIGLDIRAHAQPDNGDEATVEFIARFKVGGKAQRLHEISRFVRQPDASGRARWYYLDGSFPGA